MPLEFSHPRWDSRRARIGFCYGSAAVAAIAMLTFAEPAVAQSGGKGFLFNRPVGSFSIRGGYSIANAGSDVFSEAISQLTLSKSDFGAIAWGGDISYSATPRVDVVFDGAFSASSANSEFRQWVDNNDEPIQQGTSYRRMPLTVGLKYYLADRGRAISQFAYVPAKYAPYVGVGGGAMWYRFKQKGDFVDFATNNLEIFSAELESSGWTPMAHGMAGVDYSLTPSLAITAEGRYQWARAQLDRDVFEGFEKIDLSGFAATVGFKVRF